MIQYNRVASALLAFIAALGLGTQVGRSSPAEDPKVVFEMHHDNGNGGTGPGGLVIAAWSDGVVVFSSSPDKPGQDLQTGSITPQQLRAVFAELKNAGFFDEHKSRGWPPDAQHTRITAHLDEKRVSYDWWEWVDSPRNANVDSDPGFKAFAKMWAVSKVTLAFAYPSAYKPLRELPDVERRFSKAVGKNEVSR